ncbi:hypothetical protein LEP1GSC034_1879 [Leptospira interrogans str. 2003000735]|uniref:Uncharacterized protein n=1 Tax=Leptospira interrogans str. 2002000626 TaxID=996803 RepID=A0A829DDD3_LEPIR|nr:hypothetical protein LEP1GSC027_0641 [Leptospira interrogans str. 2002000624]EKQ37695.1 hypothetical protein LEP1GSC025_3116 [Leptospira interrogans str. 2002000621]EKQ47226.1 hypothetical protein LEP1GSC026_0540 [Leptospira interrogans str. 2002000623]EMJ71940.1 hypothetical protein LEP1GSC034_1879 [Leptospira interrogans str. 2003000735]EMJ73783.1 hypothetical protein LEP1GSC033_3422 [Leptospira interrogans str. 2002000632]EMJ79639.1 hypothetical protein LEP1GSC032_1660 [Leptospira interr
MALGNSTSRFYWRSETQRLASIGARKLNVSLLLALDGFKIDS